MTSDTDYEDYKQYKKNRRKEKPIYEPAPIQEPVKTQREILADRLRRQMFGDS